MVLQSSGCELSHLALPPFWPRSGKLSHRQPQLNVHQGTHLCSRSSLLCCQSSTCSRLSSSVSNAFLHTPASQKPHIRASTSTAIDNRRISLQQNVYLAVTGETGGKSVRGFWLVDRLKWYCCVRRRGLSRNTTAGSDWAEGDQGTGACNFSSQRGGSLGKQIFIHHARTMGCKETESLWIGVFEECGLQYMQFSLGLITHTGGCTDFQCKVFHTIFTFTCFGTWALWCSFLSYHSTTHYTPKFKRETQEKNPRNIQRIH